MNLMYTFLIIWLLSGSINFTIYLKSISHRRKFLYSDLLWLISCYFSGTFLLLGLLIWWPINNLANFITENINKELNIKNPFYKGNK